MPSRPTLLLLLSVPVAVVVYTVAAQVMQEIFPKEPILSLLVPLFVAGLAVMPLIIPFFDRKATEDLAEYRRQQSVAGQGTQDAPPSAESEDVDGSAYDEPEEARGTNR